MWDNSNKKWGLNEIKLIKRETIRLKLTIRIIIRRKKNKRKLIRKRKF